MEKQALLKALCDYDTPSITNAVATYPDQPYCLGLYHPWYGKWYTDQTIRCMTPEAGRVCGHVVTVTYGMPDPHYTKLSFADVLLAIGKTEKPVILVVKQDFPEEIKKINGLLGGNMMTALKSAGVVGVVSDGPSRDVDEIRPLGLQYLLTGVTPGHGKFAIRSINTPVEVCSMMCAPGEIVHMDENGAVKFPVEALPEVYNCVAQLHTIESKRQALMRETTDVVTLGKIMKGIYDK